MRCLESSTYSAESADFPSGLSEREDSRQLPSAKSNPTAAQSSESTGPMCPASMTLENSQQQMFTELTLSAEGSLARTSALPGAARALTANAADYGKSTPVLLARYDQSTQSWRTSQHCLAGGLELFSETWPRSGMTRNGIAYQLPPLVPLTAGTESGSWPTPDASVANDGEDLDRWQERRARIKAEKKNGNGFGMPLAIAARMWPTPQAADVRDRGNLASGAIKRRMAKGKQIMLSQSVSEVSGALNPTWVEWLMGFPLGWTVLEVSETPSCRKSRKSSAGQSLKRSA